jgi:hypothetical protein
MPGKTLIRKKPTGKTLLFGIFSVALYAALFANAGLVMKYFIRGGWYAALPIATVFLFSYIHGTFAGYFWTLLGIDARKTRLQEKMEKVAVKRVRPRARLRLRA